MEDTVETKPDLEQSWHTGKREISASQLFPVPLRFLIVGGTSTLIQFGLLALFIETNLLQPIISSALSYLLSSTYNYLLNYHLTFVNTKSHIETFPKFVLVASIGIGVNTVVFALVFHLSSNYLIAQCVAVGVTLLLNYSLHKYWIYQE